MPNPGEDEAVAGTSLAYLPSGLKMQKPLNREENANWKKFKRSLENYAIVARINLFEEEFKMAMFLSAIGQDAMKLYEGTYFEPEANSKDLDDVIRKFANFSVHKTNETYKRFNFNSCQEKGDSRAVHDSFANFGANIFFCNCPQDSLLHDRLVLNIADNSARINLSKRGNLRSNALLTSAEALEQHPSE